jgi:hypothetical protein
MLTGSMASNFWGVPRTTHDLDFVLSFEADRADALVAAFDDEYALDVASVRGAFRKPYMFNAIDRRSALKVDFWMPRGVPFEETMFARRLRVTLFGEPAWIATAEDALLHKLYWNGVTPSRSSATQRRAYPIAASHASFIAFCNRFVRNRHGLMFERIKIRRYKNKKSPGMNRRTLLFSANE